MTQIIRRAILAFALIAGLGPVFAQAPAPVPALPDTERRTSYTISATTCGCAVNFALYGDSTDYQNWVEVFLNGVRIDYNDPISGWKITSPSGSIGNLARPITDAVLTFNNAQTGTVQIVGARRPRRVSQFAENHGVAARDLNQALTDIVAQNRETWDRTNDVTGRAVLAPPGETMALLPVLANRRNQGACFDSNGNLVNCVAAAGTFIAGAGITFTGSNPTTISANVSPARTYYVQSGGNDTNDCLTIGNACASLPRIASLISSSGYSSAVTINVGAGVFTGGATFTNGIVTITGAGSALTTLNDTGQNCSNIMAFYSASVTVNAVTMTTSCAGGSNIWALYHGIGQVGNDVILQSAPVAHLFAQDGGTIFTNGNFSVGGISTNLFLLADGSIRMFGGPAVVTFVGSPILTNLVDAINGSSMKTGGAQFVGTASITNKYVLSENSTLDQEQNVTELPGALQGQISGGGVYYNSGSSFTGAISGTTLTVTGMVSGNGTLGVGNRVLGTGVPANTQITAFGTGTGLNGTYTLNNSASIAAEPMTSASVFPCIDSVGLCPATVAAPTGIGTGGSVTVDNDGMGGDYSGVVTITAGTSASSSGALFVIPHSFMTNCVGSPALPSATLLTVAAGMGNAGGYRWLELAWTSAAPLVNGSTYRMAYHCR